MSPVTPPIDYAKFLGIDSVAPAVIFSILYSALFGWFLFQSFARPTYVHFVLTFFCNIRVAAFAIRAVLAASESAGEILGLVVADEILFGVGFFGLLFSAYTLVMDLELVGGYPPPENRILRFTHNRFAFKWATMTAVGLGVASSSIAGGKTNNNTANLLHRVSTVMFLVLTVLQAAQTGMLATSEISGRATLRRKIDTFGSRHAMTILLLVSLLLLIRESFSIATVNDSSKQNNEHLWYPFLALPEFVSVLLYTFPGLVPSRDEIPKATKTKTYELNDV